MIALLVDKGPQSAAQIADFFMVPAFQILNSQAHSLGIIRTYIGHPGIAEDSVIIKNGGVRQVSKSFSQGSSRDSPRNKPPR